MSISDAPASPIRFLQATEVDRIPLLGIADWTNRLAEGRSVPVGLALANDVDDALLESLAPHLNQLSVIALDFPKWVDGRSYSLARLLRQRYGYRGELRATGHVLVDMLPLLARCGFDAVVLRPDQSLDHARRALGFFDGHYQGDVREPQPRFRRDAAWVPAAGAEA
jgi:uncharacterized protein (DUF934 family)